MIIRDSQALHACLSSTGRPGKRPRLFCGSRGSLVLACAPFHKPLHRSRQAGLLTRQPPTLPQTASTSGRRGSSWLSILRARAFLWGRCGRSAGPAQFATAQSCPALRGVSLPASFRLRALRYPKRSSELQTGFPLARIGTRLPRLLRLPRTGEWAGSEGARATPGYQRVPHPYVLQGRHVNPSHWPPSGPAAAAHPLSSLLTTCVRRCSLPCREIALVHRVADAGAPDQIRDGRVDGALASERGERLKTQSHLRNPIRLSLFPSGPASCKSQAKRSPSDSSPLARLQSVKPEPFHRTPNNALGYLTGLFFRIPSVIDGAYRHMRLGWGLSGAHPPPEATTAPARGEKRMALQRAFSKADGAVSLSLPAMPMSPMLSPRQFRASSQLPSCSSSPSRPPSCTRSTSGSAQARAVLSHASADPTACLTSLAESWLSPCAISSPVATQEPSEQTTGFSEQRRSSPMQGGGSGCIGTSKKHCENGGI